MLVVVASAPAHFTHAETLPPAAAPPARAAPHPATHTGPGGAVVAYLSMRTRTPAMNGGGASERDMSNGEKLAGDGHPLTLNGVVYARGLGVHALSDLRYTMPTGTCSFLASVGVDDEVPNSAAASVTFQVFADTTSLYLSPVLGPTSTTAQINVAVPAGTTQLRLLVDGGASNAYDHADWADAKLSCT